MNGLDGAFSPVWSFAGWVMLHFVWIGGLLLALAASGRRVLRSAHPDVRYGYALMTLTVLAVTPAIIACVLSGVTHGPEAAAAGRSRFLASGH